MKSLKMPQERSKWLMSEAADVGLVQNYFVRATPGAWRGHALAFQEGEKPRGAQHSLSAPVILQRTVAFHRKGSAQRLPCQVHRAREVFLPSFHLVTWPALRLLLSVVHGQLTPPLLPAAEAEAGRSQGADSIGTCK